MTVGERRVTRASSDNGSSAGPDLRRVKRDIGLRRLSRDLDFAAVGVEAALELPDSFSLMPLSSSEVCDLECEEYEGEATEGDRCADDDCEGVWGWKVADRANGGLFPCFWVLVLEAVRGGYGDVGEAEVALALSLAGKRGEVK